MSDRSEKIPVIDIFGPVIQGEGAVIGRQTFFLRTGGCDYLCSACDSMHAVDPKQIEANKRVMSVQDIQYELFQEHFPKSNCNMLTISGGNPLLWDLTTLVWNLHDRRYEVAVETQGSITKPWLSKVKYITVSPKGPGMVGGVGAWKSIEDVLEFLHYVDKLRPKIVGQEVTIKIPVFGPDDLDFAVVLGRKMNEEALPKYRMFLSVGNSWVGSSAPIGDLLERFRSICDQVTAEYPTLQRCTILPQLHVLAWGNARDK